MKQYRDLGCALWESRAVGYRLCGYETAGCRMQGYGALLAQLRGMQAARVWGAGAGMQGWGAVGYRGCRAMGCKVKELWDTRFRDVG